MNTLNNTKNIFFYFPSIIVLSDFLYGHFICLFWRQKQNLALEWRQKRSVSLALYLDYFSYLPHPTPLTKLFYIIILSHFRSLLWNAIIRLFDITMRLVILHILIFCYYFLLIKESNFYKTRSLWTPYYYENFSLY